MPTNVISYSYRDDLFTLGANSTDTSFAAKVPTTTKPSGAGVVEMSPGGTSENTILSYLMVIPFGTDANDETFDLRMFGWSAVAGDGDTVYVPVRLLQASCTLGTATGVNSSNFENENFLADTIASVTGSGLNSVVSPADNTVAHLIIDATGFGQVEIIYDLTGAASAGALVRMF